MTQLLHWHPHSRQTLCEACSGNQIVESVKEEVHSVHFSTNTKRLFNTQSTVSAKSGRAHEVDTMKKTKKKKRERSCNCKIERSASAGAQDGEKRQRDSSQSDLPINSATALKGQV